MYYDDHGVPHFHAAYGEDEASIGIDSATLLGGELPTRALRLVLEWAGLHREELLEDWVLARNRKPLRRIDPLN
jgi:hypothetical protein